MSLAAPARLTRPYVPPSVPPRHATSLAMLVAALLAVPVSAHAQGSTPDALAALHWRFIGPIGNRTAAVAGEPGNPMVDYAGAASGGIWKTENGGVDWRPVFDGENVAAVGALAVSQSQPHTVWAGTGETFLIRPFYPMGNGVYKSTDAGDHWQHMGLEATGHVGRIVIDPHDPQRVFVCALGQLFKPQPERGVYRTTDGGATWKQVLAEPGQRLPARRGLHHPRRGRDLAEGRTRDAGPPGRQGRRGDRAQRSAPHVRPGAGLAAVVLPVRRRR
jgi:hypothetical protein